MRLLVLRLLLLAVFFNTAVGMPVHSALHMRQVAAGTVEAFVAVHGCEVPAQAASGKAQGGAETVEAAESVCVWCMGHAPHAAAVLPHLALPMAAAAPPERVPPRAVGGSIPAQNRWAFASRDPPR